jgi:hypothetical protein
VKLFGHEKLRSKWEGPYTVINVSSHGAVTLIFRHVRFLFDFSVESMFLGYKILLENIAKKEPARRTWARSPRSGDLGLSHFAIIFFCFAYFDRCFWKMNMSRIFGHSLMRLIIWDKI